MINIFDSNDAQNIVARIENLQHDTQAQWGKMSVDQMIAHLNVGFDMAFTDKYPKPGFFGKIFLKLVVKNAVVGPKPYPKNSRTAPAFIISDKRDFEKEKSKLVAYIRQVESLGSQHFENKDYPSFGALTSQEWNNMFSKHINHHLTQFGV